MADKRKEHTAEFKAQIVLQLIAEKISMAQTCKQYSLKDSMVSRWKTEFLQRAPQIFENPQQRSSEEQQKIAELERMVGKLTMELGILKKASQLLSSL